MLDRDVNAHGEAGAEIEGAANTDSEDCIYEDDDVCKTSPHLNQDGFGDDLEQVIVGCDATAWEIDHSTGDHRLSGKALLVKNQQELTDVVRDLFTKTLSTRFNGQEAIKML